MFGSFSRSSILLEIVQNWYSKCQGHKKRCHNFSSLRVCPCPAHTPCIWGSFYHTETNGQRPLRRSVGKYLNIKSSYETKKSVNYKIKLHAQFYECPKEGAFVYLPLHYRTFHSYRIECAVKTCSILCTAGTYYHRDWSISYQIS